MCLFPVTARTARLEGPESVWGVLGPCSLGDAGATPKRGLEPARPRGYISCFERIAIGAGRARAARRARDWLPGERALQCVYFSPGREARSRSPAVAVGESEKFTVF